MTLLAIPGPLDPHVHLRDGDWAHKSTFDSETAAALAGGYWAVLDMPNAPPTTTSRERLDARLARLASSARCDVGLYAGAADGTDTSAFAGLARDVVGLKIYCDATTGDLLVSTDAERERLMRAWTAVSTRPIAVHAEEETLAAVLRICRRLRARVHFCHVSTADEVALLRAARADGLPVSAGACPHHLFLTHVDAERLGPLGLVRPPLRMARDRDALWTAIAEGVIDLVESDHAPHTRAEKASASPPAGLPGLETTLPLLATAVGEGRLTTDRLIDLVAHAPQRLFGLRPPPETSTLLDLDAPWVIEDAALLTAPGWSPFAGMRVGGRVREVRIGGRLAFDGERVLAEPGSGTLLVPA